MLKNKKNDVEFSMLEPQTNQHINRYKKPAAKPQKSLKNIKKDNK